MNPLRLANAVCRLGTGVMRMKLWVLALAVLVVACGRDTPITEPEIIESNPVRPGTLIKPLPEATNSNQQLQTNRQQAPPAP